MSGSNDSNYYSSHIDRRQPPGNGVLDGRIDRLENIIQQIAAHIGLFQCEDQHGDKSHDFGGNSHAREARVHEEQQVQDCGCGGVVELTRSHRISAF